MDRADSPVDGNHSALLVVDMQYDFLPGGALAVEDGDSLIIPIAALMNSTRFSVVVATQDWHPSHHVSFASSHRGKKPFDGIVLYGHNQTVCPDHCIQGERGAELHANIPLKPVNAVIRKGENSRVDSYSAFRNNWNSEGKRPKTGLAGYLRDRAIDSVFVCGLARDVCVRWTAEDAAREEFSTVLLWDLSRSVNPEDDDSLREELAQSHVSVANSAVLGMGRDEEGA